MPRILALFVSWALISTVLAVEPFSAEKIAKAEATFKEVLGDEHDKMAKATKVADRSKYAKKLLEKAKQSAGDPVLADVIRNKALPFAGHDATGIEAALEIHKSNLEYPPRKGISLEKIAELSEKLILEKPVAERSKFAAEIQKNYRDAISEYEKALNPISALAAVAKARTFARRWTSTAKDVFAALDADEKRLQPKAAEQAEVEKFKPAVEKNPGDPKARLALGLAYLKADRLAEAGEQLKEAGPEWKAFGEFAAAKTASAGEVFGVAYDLALALPAEEKRARLALFDFAVEKAELARNDPNANWNGLREKYIDALERLGAADANRAANNAPALVAAYLEWAEEQLGAKRTDSASISTAKARSACKTAKPSDAKDLFAEVDHLEKAIKALAGLEAEAEKWKDLAGQGPLDAKSCFTYGVVQLRLGKLPEAAELLAKAEAKNAQQLGALLSKKIKSPPLERANALRAFAQDLKGEDKNGVLGVARTEYEAYLQSNPADAAEKARVELLVKELPTGFVPGQRPGQSGRVISLIDENPGLVEALKTNGNTKISWDTAAFSGKGCLLINQNLNTGKLEEWTIPMNAATPDKNYRYIRFAWRTSKETEAVSLGFFFKDSGGSFSYTIGAAADGAISVADSTSDKWTVVTRDIQHDFPKASGTVIGSYFTVKGKNSALWLDSLQFATSPKAFPPLRATKK